MGMWLKEGTERQNGKNRTEAAIVTACTLIYAFPTSPDIPQPQISAVAQRDELYDGNFALDSPVQEAKLQAIEPQRLRLMGLGPNPPIVQAIQDAQKSSTTSLQG